MNKKAPLNHKKTVILAIALLCLTVLPIYVNAQNFSIGPGWNIYGVETTPATIENPPNDGNNQTPHLC